MPKQGFTIRIPLPPSVNHMHRSAANGRRYSSAEYRAWARTAGWEALTQKPQRVEGLYEVTIALPEIRGDADNRIKPVLDLLHRLQLTADDHYCRGTLVQIVPQLEKTSALVTVRPHLVEDQREMAASVGGPGKTCGVGGEIGLRSSSNGGQ